MPDRVTKDEAATIEPFTAIYMQMVEMVHDMNGDQLAKLLQAANAHSHVNCWFRTYDAAQILKDVISTETAFRRALKDTRAALQSVTKP